MAESDVPMPNKSREENFRTLLEQLARSKHEGLTVQEASDLLFGNSQSKSVTKKLLEELRGRGIVQLKMTSAGHRYFLKRTK